MIYWFKDLDTLDGERKSQKKNDFDLRLKFRQKTDGGVWVDSGSACLYAR